MFVLVVKEALRDSLIELPEEVSVVLKEFLDSLPLKIPNYLSPMLDIQYVIYFERHIELLNSLPPICDGENEDNLNLLGRVQIISSKA